MLPLRLLLWRLLLDTRLFIRLAVVVTCIRAQNYPRHKHYACGPRIVGNLRYSFVNEKV